MRFGNYSSLGVKLDLLDQQMQMNLAVALTGNFELFSLFICYVIIIFRLGWDGGVGEVYRSFSFSLLNFLP